MKLIEGEAIFSTGKVRDVAFNIIGINDNLDITSGADYDLFRSVSIDGCLHNEWLTPDEQVELADFMIARWNAFKERAKESESNESVQCHLCGSITLHEACRYK